MFSSELLAEIQIRCSSTDKPRFARAQLPTELDDNLQSLICDCWNAEPSLRPSFEVVELRLKMIVKATTSSRNRKLVGLLRPRPSAETQDEAQKRKANAIKLCKDIHKALWQCSPELWDKRTVAHLVRADADVTASDKLLNEIVEGERGCHAIRSCGNLMIGNVEDGSEVIPDPLLEKDILVNLATGMALLTVRFSVSVGGSKKPQTSSGGFEDKSEFEGLLEKALAEQATALDVESTPLADAVTRGLGTKAVEMLSGPFPTLRTEATPEKKKMRKIKKKKKKNRPGGNLKKGSVEHTFESFVKAARFVRYGDGVKVLHPSSKLQLHALMMQAQYGDSPNVHLRRGYALQKSPLELQKRKAWEHQKGKKRKEAMEEYVKFLSELAPQWKLSNLIAGRASAQGEVGKPRRMMWVIRVNFADTEERIGLEGEQSESVAQRLHLLKVKSFLQVTSLHIMQGANGSQAKEWFQAQISDFVRKKSRALALKVAEDGVDDCDKSKARELREYM